MKDKLSEIIEKEYIQMINSIKSDFKKNFCKKKYNFLLDGLNIDTKIALVFASSFESKIGNAMQKVAFKIARLKFGEENVPSIINIHDIEHNVSPKNDKQIILTNVDIHNVKLNSNIAGLIQKNEGNLKCKPPRNCSLNTDKLKKILIDLPTIDNVIQNDIDLAFYDGCWNLFEIKAGGDLDNSNARGNVLKLLKSYAALNDNTAKIYFATYYHKTGEGNTWCGSIKKFLQYPNMFLIGKDFWDRILPESITFNDFKIIYLNVMDKIKIENIIDDLKTICEE